MQQITLKIDGMMCGMCESHINESIRNNFSVGECCIEYFLGLRVRN